MERKKDESQNWTIVTKNSVKLSQGQYVVKVFLDENHSKLHFVEFISNKNIQYNNSEKSFSGNGIEINKKGIFQFRVVDANGVLIEEGAASNVCIIGADFPSGVYFLTI